MTEPKTDGKRILKGGKVIQELYVRKNTREAKVKVEKLYQELTSLPLRCGI